MNGRIYDPTLGRFLQADPVVQAPTDSQSYNRYTYVRNNPLSLTDPSGYSWISKTWKKIKPFIGVIAGALVAAYCPSCTASLWSSALTGAAIGAGSAAANGGNILKGALVGAFSGAAFYQIGQSFDAAKGFFTEGGFGHIGAHGLTGGIGSVLQGGKFGHGFISAGLTKAMNVNSMIGTAAKDAVLRVVTAAAIGGSISRITGGKFTNGAITAAFAQAFNGEKQAERTEQENAKRLWDMGKEGVTYHVSLGASVIVIGGFEFSLGVYFTPGTWDTFDFGFVGSYGEGFGLNFSADAIVGVSDGNYLDMRGPSTNVNAMVGQFSSTVAVPSNNNLHPTLATAGGGISLTPVAFSVTESNTATYGRQWAIEKMTNFMCSISGNC